MTREAHFEKLEQFIFDESRMVTYKIISRELKISVNEAKQYLQEFLEDHKTDNLNSTYFLSGVAGTEPGSPLKVYVVSKKNLEKTKESLSEVTSCHVYSVSKAVVEECTLYRLDMRYNTNEEEYRNYTVIKHPNVEIKAPVLTKTNGVKKEVKAAIPKKEGTSFFKNIASNAVKKNDKTEPSESKTEGGDIKKVAKPLENSKSKTQSPAKTSNSESKAQKPNTLASMWQKNEEKSKKTEDSKPGGKVKTKSPQETKQMPKNNIISMFSKQAEKKTDNLSKKSSSVLTSSKTAEESTLVNEKLKRESESPNKTEKIKEQKPSRNKRNKFSHNIQSVAVHMSFPAEDVKHKKDVESDDEFQSKKRKRRRICTPVSSDSESEEEEQDKIQRSFLSPEEPMETKPPAKPATPVSEDEEPIPPTPPVVSSKGKKKVWKTVPKTFEDEDGFFVTKQEKVLVSEDDEDPLPQSSKSKEVSKPNQFAYRKQASLTSFFKQK